MDPILFIKGEVSGRYYVVHQVNPLLIRDYGKKLVGSVDSRLYKSHPDRNPIFYVKLKPEYIDPDSISGFREFVSWDKKTLWFKTHEGQTDVTFMPLVVVYTTEDKGI